MMSPTLAARAAIQTGMGLWKLYEEAWRSGEHRETMPLAHFFSSFRDRNATKEACATNDKIVRRWLEKTVRSFDPTDIVQSGYDRDVHKVLNEYGFSLPREAVASELSNLQGSSYARESNAFRWLVEFNGREQAREFLLQELNSFNETVQKALLEEASNKTLLLPHEAARLTLRQQQFLGYVGPLTNENHRLMAHVARELAGMAAPSRDRLAALLKRCHVRLSTDPEDFPQATWLDPSFIPNKQLRHVIERLGIPPETLYPIETTLAGNETMTRFSVSVLRILHMHALLSGPFLATESHASLSPVLLKILSYLNHHGGDSIRYDGELCLDMIRTNSLNKSWLRAEAERHGECFAIMFLEDAAGLDLSTLYRIPEEATPTPDFAALGAGNNKLVIEAKGTTTLSYFRSSRKRALKQLGKMGSLSQKASAERVFLSRLLIAERGDARSLLAVEDPPVDFGSLFSEERRAQALQRHVAAVAHLAGMTALARFAVADAGNRERMLSAANREVEASANLVVGNTSYLGRQEPVQGLLSLAGLPIPEELEPVVFFRGIAQDVATSALNGSIRARGGRQQIEEDQVRDPYGEGVLPDGRGVYSVLTNGSVLAFMTGG